MMACGCVSNYLSSINCVGALASVYFVCGKNMYLPLCSVCSCITFRHASACNFARWGVCVHKRVCVNMYIDLNLYMHIFVFTLN